MSKQYEPPTVGLDQLRPSAVKQLLVEALQREADRQLPMHRRGKEEGGDKGEEPEENDKLIDMVEETKGKPAGIPVTKDDLSKHSREPMEDSGMFEDDEPVKEEKPAAKSAKAKKSAPRKG